MSTAFQSNAFQGNAFQIGATAPVIAQAPFAQLDWNVARAPAHPPNLRTWLYNGTIFQPVAANPFSETDWQLPQSPVFPQHLRTHVVNLQQTTLAAAPQAPFVQDDWPLSPSPRQPAFSWTFSYNVNLIGQDRLPSGEQRFDLAPKGHEYSNALRSWIVNLQQTTLARLPVGGELYDRTPLGAIQPLREWAWSYNRNLIGQDALPTGEQRLELAPVGYSHPTQLRTWIDYRSRALDFTAGQAPFSQQDWPNPRAPLQAASGFTWSYNLNLVGKDVLPTGEQVFELPPRDHLRPIPIWTASYNRNLIGQDQLPVGEQKLELTPAPRAYSNELRSWIDKRSRALDFVAGTLPNGQQVYERAPRDDRQSQFRGQTWSYNLNLIGKDRLPTGEQVFDLPSRITAAAIQTWINQTSLALRGAPVVPLSQQDWPNPQRVLPAARTWTASFNLNLIGKDQLPVGEQVYERAPRGHIYPPDLRTLVRHLNLALVVPPAPLPKNQSDWPLPRGPHYPTSNRGFINFSNPALVPPAPPAVLPRDPTHLRTRGGFELDARGPPSVDSRRTGRDARGQPSLDRRGTDRFYRGDNES